MNSVGSWVLLVLFWSLVGATVASYLDLERLFFASLIATWASIFMGLVLGSMYFLKWSEAWPFIPQ